MAASKQELLQHAYLDMQFVASLAHYQHTPTNLAPQAPDTDNLVCGSLVMASRYLGLTYLWAIFA
jgi:hypothetical protein